MSTDDSVQPTLTAAPPPKRPARAPAPLGDPIAGAIGKLLAGQQAGPSSDMTTALAVIQVLVRALLDGHARELELLKSQSQRHTP